MKNTDAFSNLHNDYDQARPAYPDISIKKLTHYLANIQQPTILDVGCGTGIFTRQLAHLFKNANVFGSDINKDMIDRAVRSSIREFPNIGYQYCEAEQLPYDDNQFDLLTVAQAVQWFNRPVFYQEALRLLKSSGALALIENNRAWQHSDFLNDYEALLEAYSPKYSRHYRANNYAAEMTEHGFEEPEIFEHIWQRPMAKSAFIQMTKSSTKMQSALKKHGKVVEQKLSLLLSKYSDSNGMLNIEYVTKVIVAKV